MTVAQRTSLQSQVLAIISQAGTEALSIPQIEVQLKNDGHWDADTFDVRDTVAELVEERKAEFVPGRLVRQAGQ